MFIDELGELSPALQAKLLRVIQSREFSKVGGTKSIRTDIRLITATNKDLRAAVAQGTFREDLYYRVAVFMIKVPSLRERIEDIPRPGRSLPAALREPLRQAGHARRAGDAQAHDDPAVAGQRPAARELPGAGGVLAEGDTLTDRDLFAGDLSAGPPRRAPVISGVFEAGLPLSEVERRHILRTLHKVHGNRTEAARLLQISVRCLQYKLSAYGRDVETTGSDRGLVPSACRLRRGAHLSLTPLPQIRGPLRSLTISRVLARAQSLRR